MLTHIYSRAFRQMRLKKLFVYLYAPAFINPQQGMMEKIKKNEEQKINNEKIEGSYQKIAHYLVGINSPENESKNINSLEESVVGLLKQSVESRKIIRKSDDQKIDFFMPLLVYSDVNKKGNEESDRSNKKIMLPIRILIDLSFLQQVADIDMYKFKKQTLEGEIRKLYKEIESYNKEQKDIKLKRKELKQQELKQQEYQEKTVNLHAKAYDILWNASNIAKEIVALLVLYLTSGDTEDHVTVGGKTFNIEDLISNPTLLHSVLSISTYIQDILENIGRKGALGNSLSDYENFITTIMGATTTQFDKDEICESLEAIINLKEEEKGKKIINAVDMILNNLKIITTMFNTSIKSAIISALNSNEKNLKVDTAKNIKNNMPRVNTNLYLDINTFKNVEEVLANKLIMYLVLILNLSDIGIKFNNQQFIEKQNINDDSLEYLRGFIKQSAEYKKDISNSVLSSGDCIHFLNFSGGIFPSSLAYMMVALTLKGTYGSGKVKKIIFNIDNDTSYVSKALLIWDNTILPEFLVNPNKIELLLPEKKTTKTNILSSIKSWIKKEETYSMQIYSFNFPISLQILNTEGIDKLLTPADKKALINKKSIGEKSKQLHEEKESIIKYINNLNKNQNLIEDKGRYKENEKEIKAKEKALKKLEKEIEEHNTKETKIIDTKTNIRSIQPEINELIVSKELSDNSLLYDTLLGDPVYNTSILTVKDLSKENYIANLSIIYNNHANNLRQINLVFNSDINILDSNIRICSEISSLIDNNTCEKGFTINIYAPYISKENNVKNAVDTLIKTQNLKIVTKNSVQINFHFIDIHDKEKENIDLPSNSQNTVKSTKEYSIKVFKYSGYCEIDKI